MNDIEWCIDYLKESNHIKENLSYDWSTFRALLNITMPFHLSEEFYQRQDKVLKDILSKSPYLHMTDRKSLFVVLFREDVPVFDSFVRRNGHFDEPRNLLHAVGR
ncbi:MAG: hypothetical protein IJ194_04220, partial [Bacilli bacterium]|nr:hypothetical protein [Bacilli bacterium]